MAETDDQLRKLKVLSLNCWGLKFVSKYRRERIQAIATWIANSQSASSRSSYHSDQSDERAQSNSTGYDVVALQEIWVRDDFELIASRAKEAGLLYSRFFYSGAIGAGLAILSAHPIISTTMFPYPLNGYPLHFIEGDFFAGKGVCGVSIDVPELGLVDVLNTHMYAPGGEGEGVDGVHRVAQAWELARIVRERVERGRHVVVMGDLNSQPDSIIIRILLTHGSLTDSFAQTPPAPPAITSSAHLNLTQSQTVHTHGITCDSPLNTFSAPKLAKRNRMDQVVVRGGKRLDYVLYRSPPTSPKTLVATTSTVVLTTETLPPPFSCSLSDHFGLQVVLHALPATSTVNPISSRPVLPPPPQLALEDLTKSLANLNVAYRNSLISSQFQLRLFLAAVALLPALAIAASFQPLLYLSWLFTLLSGAVGAGGATMLYTGFVGGRWEAGGLRNVMSEMEAELARRRSEEGVAGPGASTGNHRVRGQTGWGSTGSV
ncbi:hypothetical protein T439DRAFT_308331 [Meredithblackwellia eburnea MCA 4105]